MNMSNKNKNRDTHSIIGLVLMFLVIIFSGFSINVSFILLAVFIVWGYFIVKRQNNLLKPKKCFLIFLFMISGMLFVIFTENLENIFRINNKLVALILSLIPSIIYFIVDKKAKR